MIVRVHHVGISVSSLDRSLEFYRDVLGMEVVEAPGVFAGEQYAAIMGLEGATGKTASVKIGDLEIELFEFAHPPAKPADPARPVCDHGITHFCLLVSDIDSEYARLQRSGVRFHCSPLTFFGTAKATYARDPDGNVFELLEMLEPQP